MNISLRLLVLVCFLHLILVDNYRRRKKFGSCPKKIKKALKRVCNNPLYHKKRSKYLKYVKCMGKKTAIERKLPEAGVLYKCCLKAFGRWKKKSCKKRTKKLIFCMLKYYNAIMAASQKFLKIVSPFDLEFNDSLEPHDSNYFTSGIPPYQYHPLSSTRRSNSILFQLSILNGVRMAPIMRILTVPELVNQFELHTSCFD
ncbi:hypothetical protein RF11_08807 [Thelohanellus kitauei]|uniref:Uncharacterized protein n=1 Tax=Thelohanellus kitauei TaxID=669202 RepID=A0A0C2MQR3_THEKT|nr:hypothetical protein RF11_08807 [Thelohanellus kitauei]